MWYINLTSLLPAENNPLLQPNNTFTEVDHSSSMLPTGNYINLSIVRLPLNYMYCNIARQMQVIELAIPSHSFWVLHAAPRPTRVQI
jgi:hypothetical protein